MADVSCADDETVKKPKPVQICWNHFLLNRNGSGHSDGSDWIIPLLEGSNWAESEREGERSSSIAVGQRWDRPEMDSCIINEAQV